MRLRIGKDGQYLDLDRGTGVQIDARSPVYFGDRSPEFIPGVKTYTFQIPKTPHNRKLLGDPARLDNPWPFLTETGWRIEFDSRVLFTGVLEVESAAWRGNIDVTFIGGLAGSLAELKENKLADLDLHTSFSVGESEADLLDHATYVTQNPADFEYRFPTIRVAADTAPEQLTDEEGNVTGIRPTQYSYLNLYRDGHVKELELNGFNQSGSIAPQPKLEWVLRRTLAAVGYHLTGVFDTAPEREELRELIVFSNYTQDQVTGSVTGDKPTVEDISFRPVIDLNRQVPDVLANDFIRAVCNTFAWGLFVEPDTQRAALVPYRDILADNSFLDWTGRVDPNYLRERSLEGLPQNFGFDYADDFPNPWPLRVADLRNVVTFDNTGTATFDSGFTSEDIGQVIYIRSINEYGQLFRFRGTAALYLSIGRDLATYNRPARNTYRPELTTPLLDTGLSSGTNGAIGLRFNVDPITQEPTGRQPYDAYTPAFYTELVTPITNGDRTDKIALMLYRGLQLGNDENAYPFATNNRYNSAQELIGSISLLWDQPGGIWPTWWEQWYEVLQRLRPVTYATRLTSRDLSGLDFRRKIRIDGQMYLLRRVRVTLTTERILPATVEYMQLQ